MYTNIYFSFLKNWFENNFFLNFIIEYHFNDHSLGKKIQAHDL